MPVRHCSAVLFPLVVTVYVTWWFLTFFDNFFSVGMMLQTPPAAVHQQSLQPLTYAAAAASL